MTLKRIASDSGVTVKGPEGAEGTPSVSVTEQAEILTPGSSEDGTEEDRTYTDHTDAEIDYSFQLHVSPPPANPVVLDHEVSDSDVAEIEDNSLVVGKEGQHGNVSVVCRTAWGNVKTAEHEVGVANPSTTREYTGFVEGSLAKHLVDQIDGLISGVEAGDATQKVFTTRDHGTPEYVRNENLWLDVDLTCASPYQDGSASEARTGTLIVADGCLTANHYPPSVGATIRFVASDGTVVDREITGSQRISGTDLRVLVLASDVPGTITPAKLFPADLDDYMPSLSDLGSRVPVAALNKLQQAGLWLTTTDICRYTYPLGYESFFLGVHSGDSGHPWFSVVNGVAVLATLWRGGWWHSADGEPVHDYLTEIDAALSDLGSGHSVETVDLSGFPTY